MSALSAASRNAALRPDEATGEAARARARLNRRLVVNGLRILFAVVVLGSWELGAAAGWVDPLFYCSPSGVVTQLRIWLFEGTAHGPLWRQIPTARGDATLGFLICSRPCVIFRV